MKTMEMRLVEMIPCRGYVVSGFYIGTKFSVRGALLPCVNLSCVDVTHMIKEMLQYDMKIIFAGLHCQIPEACSLLISLSPTGSSPPETACHHFLHV